MVSRKPFHHFAVLQSRRCCLRRLRIRPVRLSMLSVEGMSADHNSGSFSGHFRCLSRLFPILHSDQFHCAVCDDNRPYRFIGDCRQEMVCIGGGQIQCLDVVAVDVQKRVVFVFHIHFFIDWRQMSEVTSDLSLFYQTGVWENAGKDKSKNG